MSTEPSPEPTSEAAFFSTIRRWGIVRGDNRVFGGVLSGVGARIGMAPAAARFIFVLIALITGGLGLLAYAAAWALLPDTEGRIIIQDFGRGRPNVGALVAIAILTLIGFGSMGHFVPADLFNGFWGENTGWFGDGNMGPMSGLFRVFAIFAAVVIPIAIVAGVVVLIVWAVRSSKTTDRASQGYARRPDGSLPDAPVAPSAASAAGEADVPDEACADPAYETPVLAAMPATASAAALPPMAPPPPILYSAPPRPPRPRVPGPGKVGYLLALAWIPITIAITLYLSTTGQLAVFGVIAGGVIYVAGLGVILVITALRGRKLGFLGFLSVVAMIPVAVAIGAAPELREHYASGDWHDWVNEQVVSESSSMPSLAEPSIGPDEAFDPTQAFYDYNTVAIAGTCSPEDGISASDSDGTVALSSVSADQTITVTSSSTRLIIPDTTSLKIVSSGSVDMPVNVDVRWLDRDVSCFLNGDTANGVQLMNPGAPVLTVRLDDVSQMGQMNLYIEEN